MTNIRNPQNYVNSFWDWSYLNPIFAGTRIRISDIDGVFTQDHAGEQYFVVDNDGEVLHFETKAPGQEITHGQHLLHWAWTRTGKISVLRIWGEPNQPIEMQLWRAGAPAPDDREPSSRHEVYRVVDTWWRQSCLGKGRTVYAVVSV